MPYLHVAFDLPLDFFCEYDCPDATEADLGFRVRVPFGQGREKIGVIVAVSATTSLDAAVVRTASEILRDVPPLPKALLELVRLLSDYFLLNPNAAVCQCLPGGLKRLRRPKRRPRTLPPPPPPLAEKPLTAEQQAALATIDLTRGFQRYLLFGVTGSGKTELYLQLAARVLATGQQLLLLLPEINLTPQLERQLAGRFPERSLVVLHSDVTPAERESAWLRAADGEADIVLGTRLAILTPMPRLGLIIVDEEHDPSYRQHDGLRYSARDAALFRAANEKLPIVLGSATPSLESWANAERGRYQLVELRSRANPLARLPQVSVIKCDPKRLVEGMSPELYDAIGERLERGEQSLLFINRRGYAPVLACMACGWSAQCRNCSAHLVVHWQDKRLCCHHCGASAVTPLACPSCGNQALDTFGRGSQRLEMTLSERFPAARIVRVDRDSVKDRRSWLAILERIHNGEADILVGTQMLAKGHDFPRLTLVAALAADAALLAADCRAPERLFALLMQVAGRAGRADLPGDVLIQTQYPEHALFQALIDHDYRRFASAQLTERSAMGLPPFSHQAMLRADAPKLADALRFLLAAAAWPGFADHPEVVHYDAVPLPMVRVARLERAQLLVESASRRRLRAMLPAWQQAISAIAKQRGWPSALRWHIEVDPIDYG